MKLNKVYKSRKRKIYELFFEWLCVKVNRIRKKVRK
jgi:hypothetical protein